MFVSLLICFYLVGRLMELHGEGKNAAAPAVPPTTADGATVERPDGYEPPVVDSV